MSDIDDERIASLEWQPECGHPRRAYEMGRKRREENLRNPRNSGGPRTDGYDTMTSEEREAYKRGFRGD